jgi:hypothetical protein
MRLVPSFSQPYAERQVTGEFQNIPQSLCGIWYMKAVTCGAIAINNVEQGLGPNNLKEFALMSVLAVISGNRAIHHLEEYLDSRQGASPVLQNSTQDDYGAGAARR